MVNIRRSWRRLRRRLRRGLDWPCFQDKAAGLPADTSNGCCFCQPGWTPSMPVCASHRQSLQRTTRPRRHQQASPGSAAGSGGFRDARPQAPRYAAPPCQTNKHLPPLPCAPASPDRQSLPPRPPLPELPEPPAALLPILATLHHALSHIRYAVCGTAAMQLWGMRESTEDREPRCSSSHSGMVTIACPRATRQVLVTWATSMGLQIDGCDGWPDVLGLPCGRDGTAQPLVHVQWEGDGDEDEDEDSSQEDVGGPAAVWSTATVPGFDVPVFTLPALLQRAADAYAHGTDDEAVDPEVRSRLARDIFWILRRLRRMRRQGQQPAATAVAGVPALLDPFFYAVFPQVYPDAERLFAAAGLPLPTDASMHHTAKVAAVPGNAPPVNSSGWHKIPRRPLPPNAKVRKSLLTVPASG